MRRAARDRATPPRQAPLSNIPAAPAPGCTPNTSAQAPGSPLAIYVPSSVGPPRVAGNVGQSAPEDNDMTNVRSAVLVIVAAMTCGVAAQSGPAPKPKLPKGFSELFNGKDLTGWRGRQPNYNPAEEAKLSKEELAAKQAEWNAGRDLHWKVDAAKQEIVSDGQSPQLATAKDYGDFELHVEWL